MGEHSEDEELEDEVEEGEEEEEEQHSLTKEGMHLDFEETSMVGTSNRSFMSAGGHGRRSSGSGGGGGTPPWRKPSPPRDDSDHRRRQRPPAKKAKARPRPKPSNAPNLGREDGSGARRLPIEGHGLPARPNMKIPDNPSLNTTAVWWQHVLGYEEINVMESI